MTSTCRCEQSLLCLPTRKDTRSRSITGPALDWSPEAPGEGQDGYRAVGFVVACLKTVLVPNGLLANPGDGEIDFCATR